jgi:predicted O-methyltransferase YrrM
MAQRRLQVEGPLGEHLDALLAAPEPIAARYAEIAGEPDSQMMTHPDLGRLLAVLVAASGGRAVLELGTFVGISAAWMAGSLAPDGHLDTLEADPERAARAEAWFRRIGIGDRVTVHRGPAADTMARLPDAAYDLCYIDADKAGYPDYLAAALRLVRPGGLIVADNILASGRVALPPERDAPGTAGLRRYAAEALAHPRLTTSILTVGDGVAVSVVRLPDPGRVG